MIYFDNSATTAPCPEAQEAALRALKECWGNPSSAHFAGLAARKIKEEAREKVAKSVGMNRMTDGKIVFTSGGTEANNLALLGCVYSKERPLKNRSRGKIIISDGEHASVNAAAEKLEREGFEVYRIPTKGGALDLGDLRKNATGDVIIASIMAVNNETGALYDVKSAAEIIREAAPGAVIHSDCVQAYMKMRLTPKDLSADMITLSAHKIFGAKGAGALYISNAVVKAKIISPLFFGGGQEEGYRSGTEALPAIAAFGAAAEAGMREFSARTEAVLRVGTYAETALAATDGVRLNLPEKRLPNILNITVRGIKSETLLNYLSGEGICVSKSSACSSRSRNLSPALLAFGLSDEDADSSLRLSFSHLNTEEEIDSFRAVLSKGCERLSKIRKQPVKIPLDK